MYTNWIALSVAAFSLVLASPAARADKQDIKDMAVDILSGIAEQAQEAESNKKCDRLEALCEDGKEWACQKADRECE